MKPSYPLSTLLSLSLSFLSFPSAGDRPFSYSFFSSSSSSSAYRYLVALLSLSLSCLFVRSPSSLSLFPRFTVPQSRQNSAQVHVARCILSRGNALRGYKGPSFVGPF